MTNKTIKDFAKAYESKTANEKICKALRDGFVTEGAGVYRFSENQKTYIVEVKETSGRRAQNKERLAALLTAHGITDEEWESTFDKPEKGPMTVTGTIATKA